MFFFFIALILYPAILLSPAIYALFAKDWWRVILRLAIGYIVLIIAINVLYSVF